MNGSRLSVLHIQNATLPMINILTPHAFIRGFIACQYEHGDSFRIVRSGYSWKIRGTRVRHLDTKTHTIQIQQTPSRFQSSSIDQNVTC